MASSTTETRVGRPKIQGLVSLNLRILASDLSLLDEAVEEERAARADPGFTRTDMIRELIHEAMVKRSKRKERG